MVLQAISGTVQPIEDTTIFFFAWLLLLLWGTGHYRFSWYKCIIAIIVTDFSLHLTALKLFIALFLFRYVRLIYNLTAFLSYRPIAISQEPSLTAKKDVTVIVPTVEPYGNHFEECIESIDYNEPSKIIVVTAGPGNYEKALSNTYKYTRVIVMNCNFQNKREQVCMAIPEVDTKITVLCDDHVFWPRFWPHTFLPSVLAPFEDPEVGCVGTNKRVRRTASNFTGGYWNLLGCTYLERHNFEIAATNAIDGGVFVVSGRTSAHRTDILNDESFITGFKNEYLDTWIGYFGPLNADDDNFITRWMVEHDHKIRIQYSEEACIQTTVGEYPKFLSQCMRWARTTWRSNPRSLCSRKIWTTQWWSVYAVHITSLFNFALIVDGALLYMAWICLDAPKPGIAALLLWILCSKLVKPWPHFRRHPWDLRYLPGYILFGYVHSVIKFVALVTFWNIAWGSRPLGAAGVGGASADSDGDGGPLMVVDGEECWGASPNSDGDGGPSVVVVDGEEFWDAAEP